MLYATTRSKNDVHTAYKVIHQDCAADGGLFVPLLLPKFDLGYMISLKNKSCSQIIADILNCFFSVNLQSWDVEFAIGRNAILPVAINNRIVVAECWHNSHWKFDYVVQALSDRIRKEDPGVKATNWVNISVRIALIFALYGMLQANGQLSDGSTLDIAVTAGDFSTPIACWYAREMGLPIGNIVCGCNANSAAWELLHRGQVITSAVAVKTCTPDADFALPRDMERLISGTLDQHETERYLQCCSNGTTFFANELTFEQLRKGMFAFVISDSRVRSIIVNVFRSSGYVLSPYAALAYGSLSDYRSKTGEGRIALLLSECSPVRSDSFVADSMNISIPELEKLLNLA